MIDHSPKKSVNNFKKELVSGMYDANVKFGQIFHIPTLSILNIPREFKEDFLGEVEVKGIIFEKLKSSWPELFDKYILDFENVDEEIFVEAITDLGEKQFLINIQATVPSNFQYNESGKFISCSLNGGYYNYWIFANDFVEAAEVAVKIGEDLLKVELGKDRQRKGMEVSEQ